MEADQMSEIEIDAVAWDRTAAVALEHRRLEVPFDLDEYSVQSWVESRFGAPTGTAHASPPGPDDLVIGWTYPGPTLLEVGIDRPDATMLVVPFVRLGDGTRRELFVHHAEQRTRFAELARDLGTEMDTVDGRPVRQPDQHQNPPREFPGRLEDETVELHHSDPIGISLEIGGWLRRMLHERYTYLILEVGDDNRYVQFVTHDGTWLRGEVVGPSQVADVPLTDAELASIRSIGWQPPADGSAVANFWMEWGDPDTGETPDVDEAATFGALTLCDAFGVERPEDVEITPGRSRPDELH